MEYDDNRMVHYELLARLFAQEPAHEEILELSNMLKEEQDNIVVPFVGALRLLREESDAETSLKVEFSHLFLLRHGVKPYASVYLGQKPLLMQEPWSEVRQYYQRCGWKLADGQHNDDHIAVELSFMAHLIKQPDTLSQQREFFNEYLHPWAPQLFQDIIDNKYSCFYEGVARYAMSFFEEEKTFFETESDSTNGS